MPTDDRRTFLDLDDDDGGEDYTTEETRPRFRIDDEIARGGLGRVHRGWDEGLDREVAVKVLLHDRPAARARFQRETLLTARLQHPNIVPVYDGGLDHESRPYLAMRLVHGEPLADAIASRPTLTDRLELLDAVIDVCNAIAYAHSQRITHRDLKPDNILVGAYGETVVIDWGLAKDLDADDDVTAAGAGPTRSGLHTNHSLTRIGSVVGTPSYMAPEQAAGSRTDERADVYALGAVLYQVLTGARPYADREDVVAAVVEGPPVSVHALEPQIPADLVAVVHKAMARRPQDRYADAKELASELERFRNGRLVAAYAYTPWERVVRQVQAHPATSALTVTLVLFSVFGVLGLASALDATPARRLRVPEGSVRAIAEVEGRLVLLIDGRVYRESGDGFDVLDDLEAVVDLATVGGRLVICDGWTHLVDLEKGTRTSLRFPATGWTSSPRSNSTSKTLPGSSSSMGRPRSRFPARGTRSAATTSTGPRARARCPISAATSNTTFPTPRGRPTASSPVGRGSCSCWVRVPRCWPSVACRVGSPSKRSRSRSRG